MFFNKQSNWSVNLHTLFVFFTLLLRVTAQAPVLGVTLDTSARDDAERIIYSTKLTFTEDTGTLFSDGQIYGLARLGFEEMRTKYAADGVEPEVQPVMMAAMAVGNSVYISSNIKGGPFFYAYTDTHLKPEVTLALERCTTSLEQNRGVPVSGQHRTKASCAEIAALHEVCLDLLATNSPYYQCRDYSDGFLFSTTWTLMSQTQIVRHALLPVWQLLDSRVELARCNVSSKTDTTQLVPSYGTPSYGIPSYGIPSYRTPSSGIPSCGIPSCGMPSYASGVPSYRQPTPQVTRSEQLHRHQHYQGTHPASNLHIWLYLPRRPFC
jgi:hypothetical protein